MVVWDFWNINSIKDIQRAQLWVIMCNQLSLVFFPDFAGGSPGEHPGLSESVDHPISGQKRTHPISPCNGYIQWMILVLFKGCSGMI